VDRLFLDANILFSAAFRSDAGVARLWASDRSVLLTSDYAIEEARRNLHRPEQLHRLDGLLSAVERVRAITLAPELRREVDLREKDWPILGGAVAASATHLITGDRRDFGPYFGAKLFGILVLPPGEYLRRRADGTA
jgi:predicted nucleic acid-binding protein